MELKLNKEVLIGYAESFVSFVIGDIGNKINNIILFGSTARGDFTEKSDIDLFFDIKNRDEIKNIENILKNKLSKFYKSLIFKNWNQKGVKREISVHVGILNEWKLKRSIISNGIVLYGKYREIPGNLKQYIIIVNDSIKDIAKRNKVEREILGRKEKKYIKDGVLKSLGGNVLSNRVLIIPAENSDKIIALFNKEKVHFKLYEIWMD